MWKNLRKAAEKKAAKVDAKKHRQQEAVNEKFV
jgi:hypothetical protein